jgi:hypothetical protein
MMFNPWFEMRGQGASGRLFLRGACTLDHAHDVGLFHYQEILSVDFDLGAGPFAEQHPVARFDVKRNELAAFVTGSRPDGDNLAFLRTSDRSFGSGLVAAELRSESAIACEKSLTG